MISLTESPAWQALARHRKTFPARWAGAGAPPRLAGVAGLTIDYSRQPVSDETLRLLFAPPTQKTAGAARDRLFESQVVNASENLPAEHWALRAWPLRPDLAETESRLATCAHTIRHHAWHDAPIRTI